MKKLFKSYLICFGTIISMFASYSKDKNMQEIVMPQQENLQNSENHYVQKKVLNNGMTVLVRPVHQLPKVSLQIWYKVGSKDEKTGEKGIAHLIEHMIFKGTQKLSESDINAITHMLSGSTNAFTSYDYTGYLFNMPVQHWEQVLPILADCMQNVTFKDDHLNSEMKAVIQELKMYRDNYTRTLLMDMISAVFPDHPYHYTVIGNKQDLFDVHADRLRAFYKKHYWPNNATLVVVGDVDPDHVFTLAKKYFEHIPANLSYQKEKFYFNNDIISHHVTLYRDIKQPISVIGYILPGSQTKNAPLIEVMSLILGNGKASRLYKKIVDDLQLATSLAAYPILLFEHGFFMIYYEPHNSDDVQRINKIIQEEIDLIIKKGLTEQEIDRALKQAKMHYYSLLENIETQARKIGESFVATGDQNFAFHFLDEPAKVIEEKIISLLKEYFRPAVQHTGLVLPLQEQDKGQWMAMQKKSDEYDTKFLEARKRTTPIEPPVYAKKIEIKETPPFDFPKYQSFMLDNGLKVLYYNNASLPTVSLYMELKARPYYDSPELPGLYNFVTNMLTEGTKKYTAHELALELEGRGISLLITPSGILMSMLAADLPKGLELLQEIVANPRFDEKDIEKVRTQIISEIKSYWDDPKRFSSQLIKQEIYKGHPYSKDPLGTIESVQRITKKDLQDFHRKHFTPAGARLSIVGDISNYQLPSLLKKTIGQWQGKAIETIKFPDVEKIKECQKFYTINRDQVVLCFAGKSVERKNEDYDKLLLFDQIFGGGELGSLHSKLFQLREQSGLFYGISGSLVVGSSEQPGIVLVKTIVSLDRLSEAEKAIREVIDSTADKITPDDLQEAKNAIINDMVNKFATNASMASLFLSMDKFDLPRDYYDNRAQKLASITVDQVKEAVHKVLNSDRLIIYKIGRVQDDKDKKAQSENVADLAVK